MIKLQRDYDPPSGEVGLRFLVDRLWPRGEKNQQLALQARPRGRRFKR